MSDGSVRIEHIAKAFGDQTVLRDISLSVAPGAFLTILGPSGCGKTTLLRILAGLEQADSGRISVGEKLVLDAAAGIARPPQTRGFGYVFQDYALWPHMSVFENVAFPLRREKASRADKRARVMAMLEKVKLAGHAEKKPDQLSGGQKQRAGLARAMAARPDALLLDEPLSNLDANLREEIGREIRMLARETRLPCVNVTHDRREAQVLSDVIVLLRDGEIEQLGAPQDLFERPSTVFAAEFLDAGNIVEAGFWKGDGDPQPVLLPRTAIRVGAGSDARSAQVLDCRFLDGRFEALVAVGEVQLSLFAPTALDIGATVPVAIDQTALRRLQA